MNLNDPPPTWPDEPYRRTPAGADATTTEIAVLAAIAVCLTALAVWLW